MSEKVFLIEPCLALDLLLCQQLEDVSLFRAVTDIYHHLGMLKGSTYFHVRLKKHAVECISESDYCIILHFFGL